MFLLDGISLKAVFVLVYQLWKQSKLFSQNSHLWEWGKTQFFGHADLQAGI